jgi:hypothetical protein
MYCSAIARRKKVTVFDFFFKFNFFSMDKLVRYIMGKKSLIAFTCCYAEKSLENISFDF